MDDQAIRTRIEELEEEERGLRADERRAADADQRDDLAADRERLAAIKVDLDRLWDLLRQREARRNAGQDPDDAQIRDAGTVEGYLG